MSRELMAEDIRWQQRFSNYRKALERLEDFLEPPALNECEQQGLIKAFENTYELAWNTLRDLLRSQVEAFLLGSRDTLRDRNLTSHTYNLATADAIAAQIIDCYLPCFQQLRTRLEQRVQEEAP